MREIELTDQHDPKVRQAAQTIKDGFASLVTELEAGHTERFLDYLRFTGKFHKYSWRNQILIWVQKHNATRVAGYKKWQELGYQVSRGETGIGILAPVLVKTKHEGPDGKEVVGQALVGYKIVHVYDASQLTEKVKETDLFSGVPDDADQAYHLVARTLEIQGITVYERELRDSMYGYARWEQLDPRAALSPVICLKTGLPSRARTGVAIHEWAHHIIHLDPVKKPEAMQLPVAVRECQVEAISYIVSKYMGVEPVMSADYILNYKNNAQTLVENMGVIQAVSHQMIGELEKSMKELGGTGL